MNENKMREREINNALKVLGVAPHIKGFDYLRQAIWLGLCDSSLLHKMTGNNGIYGMVAQVFNTTPSRVERAIRHAIETTIFNLTADEIYAVFGNSLRFGKFDRPSNSHYIAAVVNTLEYEPEKFMKDGKKE